MSIDSNVSGLINSFRFLEILHSDPQTKTIVFLGNINNESAIISIERSHFAIDDENVNMIKLIEDLQLINQNDVYHWCKVLLHQSLPLLPSGKLNLIYPATEVHIKKYRRQRYHYVHETPELYEKYVAPYILTMKGDRIKWVYNILFEGKESETFIDHDKDPHLGFVLLPDMKWDKINLDSLYLCCIVNRLDISSIRDLRGSDVEYLKSLRKRILKVTTETFPINADELRIFVHYQPSYYHFHLHIVNIKHAGLGDGVTVGKAILLDDIIENLKLKSDYYKVRTLHYILGESHGLWDIKGFREEHYSLIEA